jgi:transposase-like protein
MVVAMNTTTIENGENNGAGERHPKRRRPSPGERERILAHWAREGRTVEEMAAASGWSTHTLYRWRHEASKKRRRESTPAPRLIAVPKPSAPSTPWAAELAIGAVSLRLGPGSPAAWVADLIRALKSC